VYSRSSPSGQNRSQVLRRLKRRQKRKRGVDVSVGSACYMNLPSELRERRRDRIYIHKQSLGCTAIGGHSYTTIVHVMGAQRVYGGRSAIAGVGLIM
jgi:hypothetical protein